MSKRGGAWFSFDFLAFIHLPNKDLTLCNPVFYFVVIVQEEEVPLGTSSGCRWVCQSQRRWTVPITLERRICTSFRWKESRAASTACHRLALETWWWPPWRKGSQISGRRSCQPSSSGSVSPGVERMASTCILKVRPFSATAQLRFAWFWGLQFSFW